MPLSLTPNIVPTFVNELFFSNSYNSVFEGLSSTFLLANPLHLLLQYLLSLLGFLNITPQEFFDTSSNSPVKLRELMENVKKLSAQQIDSLAIIVDGMLNK